ncbi:branched-chain amino acid ABC transporter permease [Paralcaligenes sp. KSB-10]|uniref:branched-chain amino acid ABC transporter permease n=1 Tax=Paralcaligenes sp. KSB-10 TaxID=2901142 RepID=UPI001E481FD7|nr:branched-chain amino acid ABC transporter permease [Paralcaligenes sp. KSB-10]UHL63976.1 branched-chain amino acid ABC transporter permease [Paralcaligenes sp. KSB-10]
MTEGWIVIENMLQALYSGIVVGSVYGLMCVGLALIFSVMRVINFAQGEFLMLGMYGTLLVFTQLGLGATLGPYIGPYVANLISAVAMFFIASFLYEVLLSRITGLRASGTEGDGHYAQLILTLGLSLVLQNGGLLVFGAIPQSVNTPLSSTAWEIGPLPGGMTLFLNQARMAAFVVAVIVILLVAAFIGRTRHGKILRAAADNPEAATYMGIHVRRAHRLAFGIGGAVTAVAGGLIATYYSFQPYVGVEFVIIMYAGVVLGGMGSTIGAFWGGMTIGLVQQLATLILPTQLQNAAIFVVFLLIILVRPQGLFGRSVERA